MCRKLEDLGLELRKWPIIRVSESPAPDTSFCLSLTFLFWLLPLLCILAANRGKRQSGRVSGNLPDDCRQIELSRQLRQFSSDLPLAHWLLAQLVLVFFFSSLLYWLSFSLIQFDGRQTGYLGFFVPCQWRQINSLSGEKKEYALS